MSETTINVDLSKFAAEMDKLGGDLQRVIKRGLMSGAARALPILHRRSEEAAPASERGGIGAVDTGQYKAGWRSEPTSDGARIRNTKPYAAVIEGGRRPSGVSKEGRKNLEGWAKRKLGLLNTEAKAAAFLIARALAKRSLRPRNVLGGGIAEIVKGIVAELEHEIESALERRG